MSEFQQAWCLNVMDKICRKEISIPFQCKSVRDQYLDPELAASIELQNDLTQIRAKVENGTITKTDDWAQEMSRFWNYVRKYFASGPLYAMACDLSNYCDIAT